MEIQNISRHRSHSPDNPKFGHFTLLFCRGRRHWSEQAHYISLRHAPYVTSALLRYNARSLRHRYERAQFTIHFIKEIKKTCSSSIVELYKHLGIFKNTRQVLLRTSLVFLKIPTRLYNPTMHSARFYFFVITHVHSYCSSHLIFCLERFPLSVPLWFS